MEDLEDWEMVMEVDEVEDWGGLEMVMEVEMVMVMVVMVKGGKVNMGVDLGRAGTYSSFILL